MVEKVGSREGSCNFCSPDENQERPVSKDSVYEIKRLCNGGLAARICSTCIAHLNEKIAMGDV